MGKIGFRVSLSSRDKSASKVSFDHDQEITSDAIILHDDSFNRIKDLIRDSLMRSPGSEGTKVSERVERLLNMAKERDSLEEVLAVLGVLAIHTMEELASIKAREMVKALKESGLGAVLGISDDEECQCESCRAEREAKSNGGHGEEQ